MPRWECEEWFYRIVGYREIFLRHLWCDRVRQRREVVTLPIQGFLLHNCMSPAISLPCLQLSLSISALIVFIFAWTFVFFEVIIIILWYSLPLLNPLQNLVEEMKFHDRDQNVLIILVCIHHHLLFWVFWIILLCSLSWTF